MLSKGYGLLISLIPVVLTYNLAVGLLLTGNLDETVLQRSVSEIVRRHESLRTSFPTRQGEPCQEVAPAGDLPIEKLDLRDLEEQERQNERQTTGSGKNADQV